MQTELEQERPARQAAEQNTRQVRKTLRELTASIGGEVAGRVAEATADREVRLRAELGLGAAAPMVAPSPDLELQRSLRELEHKITLYDIMASAGVRGDRLANMYKL